MSYDINFSKEFLDVLDKVKKVVNNLSTATKRSLLIFKNDEEPALDGIKIPVKDVAVRCMNDDFSFG